MSKDKSSHRPSDRPSREPDPDTIGTDELQAVVAEALRLKSEEKAAADAVVSEDTIEAIAAEVGLSAAELHAANTRLEHQHAEERALKEAHRQAVRNTYQELVWPAVRWVVIIGGIIVGVIWVSTLKKSRPRYVPSVVPSVSAIRSPIAKRTPGVTSSSWADLAPVGKGATSAHDQVLQGRALRKANLYQGALEHYLKAIELESDNTETWNETGITYNKLKQYDKAEAAFRRSIQCAHDSPDGAYPCYNLAGLLDDGPRRNEAIPLYLEAIRLKPKEPIYYNNLGWLYEKLGRQQEALSLYDQALIADPYYARARKNAVDLRAKLHAAPKTP